MTCPPSEPASEKLAPPLASAHRLAIRVYYEDTDFSGVVYHASYLRFLERGRTEFLRTLGIEHKVIFAGGGTEGVHFVVRAMTIDFLRPAVMDATGCGFFIRRNLATRYCNYIGFCDIAKTGQKPNCFGGRNDEKPAMAMDSDEIEFRAV